MALGCWITLFLLAFDAFAQQIVAFTQDFAYVETTSNSIPFASTFKGGEAIAADLVVQITANGSNPRRSDQKTLVVDFLMQAAIMTGLSASDAQLSQQIPAVCPTGNCKWDGYQSVGVCSRCNDVSDLLERREMVDIPMVNMAPVLNFANFRNETITEWELPNGLRLNNANKALVDDLSYAGTTVMTTQVGFDPDHTLMFRDSSTLLLSLSSLKVNELPDDRSAYLKWADTSVAASECGLYLCVQAFSTSMANGTIQETSQEVSSSRVPNSFQWLSKVPDEAGWIEQNELYNDTFWSQRSDLQLMPAEIAGSTLLNSIPNVNITQESLDSLIYYLNRTFGDLPDSCKVKRWPSQLSGLTGMVITKVDDTVSSDGKNSYLYTAPTLSTLWQTDSLTASFANLAKSMTNSMRIASQASSATNATSSLGSANTVSSFEGFQVTILVVYWEWLSLPSACVILGFIFLLMAIFETRRHRVPLWKSHALASLLHGFEHLPSTHPYNDGRITHMEDFAKNTLVSLNARNDNYKDDVTGRGWVFEQLSARVLHGEAESSGIDSKEGFRLSARPIDSTHTLLGAPSPHLHGDTSYQSSSTALLGGNRRTSGLSPAVPPHYS